ncbi:hypothetical protein BGZ63DRAFT_405729 [Mariannaea sp. PMI_226]|nr:hypothetical protein BGZ63DRAFT_405729 [Mariannaea sp. PMI_226]
MISNGGTERRNNAVTLAKPPKVGKKWEDSEAEAFTGDQARGTHGSKKLPCQSTMTCSPGPADLRILQWSPLTQSMYIHTAQIAETTNGQTTRMLNPFRSTGTTRRPAKGAWGIFWKEEDTPAAAKGKKKGRGKRNWDWRRRGSRTSVEEEGRKGSGGQGRITAKHIRHEHVTPLLGCVASNPDFGKAQ